MISVEALLIEAIVQGDQRAFAQLYRTYYKTLLRAITRILSDPIEAEDVLQDTYLKVWQRAACYDQHRGGVYNWLLNLARNTAIDALRQRKRITLVDPSELNAAELASEWPPVDLIGFRLRIDRELTISQQQLVELRYWQDLTMVEVANQLALPLGTVKTNLRRTLCSLRPVFSTEYALMH